MTKSIAFRHSKHNYRTVCVLFKICFFLNQGCNESEGRSNKGYLARLKRYLCDFWNRWDLLSHALLIAALCVRHFYIDETFTIARRTFALSLLVMYLRFLEVFLIFRQTGLTIILIKEMVYFRPVQKTKKQKQMKKKHQNCSTKNLHLSN